MNGRKSIFITGAGSGIGRETALLFANEGWYVGAFDVNEPGINSLESEIGKEGCFSQMMDVTDEKSVRGAVDAFAEKTGGKLDVLLNNAGIFTFGLYETKKLQEHHQVVDVNFKGCINCIYHCFPYLKKTPNSRIINMSSISALRGIPEAAVYSSTKVAMSAMTEALDIELEPHGIRVSDIKPPYVMTPMVDNAGNLKSFKMLSMLGGLTTSDKVAKTIWKAAHKYKLHWNIGFTSLILLQRWLLPFSMRFSVKLLTMPKISN